MKLFTFRSLRILILSLTLVSVFVYTQDQKRITRGWYQPLPLLIIPINGDDHADTSAYIQRLQPDTFSDIDRFFAQQGKQYHLVADQPVTTQLGTEVFSHPPEPPAIGSNILTIMWWSLKLRWWAWQYTPEISNSATPIRMFVVYHQGSPGEALQHSLGLQKGLIGVVHAYARENQGRQNNVVIAHEMMHTVGASDKYTADGRPLFPDGYANADQEPLYPQRRAEIMAGRIAKSNYESIMADSLRQVVVGDRTAQEINWITIE